MSTKRQRKEDLVLAHLQSGKNLTQGGAIELFNDWRLPSTINRIRKANPLLNIVTEIPKGCRHGVYSLEQP